MVDFFGIVSGICLISVDLVSHRTSGSGRFFQIATKDDDQEQENMGVFGCGLQRARQRAQAPVNNGGQALEQAEGTQAGNSNLGFEPVGPGDLIYIAVTGSPEMSRSARVTVDGKLMLPLLQEGVAVDGLTPAKIAQAVTAELVKEKLLVEPIVSAAVLEYRSRRVSVVGAVRMPANFQAVGEMRLLDAIARRARLYRRRGTGSDCFFSRRDGGEKTRCTFHSRLLAAKDSSINILLRGGEEIRVPEAPKLFMVGNVKMPGSYPLADPDGSTSLEGAGVLAGICRSPPSGPISTV